MDATRALLTGRNVPDGTGSRHRRSERRSQRGPDTAIELSADGSTASATERRDMQTHDCLSEAPVAIGYIRVSTYWYRGDI